MRAIPRNGSGVYTRTDGTYVGATVFQQEDAAGIDIEAVNLDTEAQDMADALTQSISNDGQTPILANLPMSGFKHTGVAAATAATDYLRADQGQSGGPSWAGTFGGTANALTATLAPIITAYTAPLIIRGIIAASNTTSATFNGNAVGEITIKKKLASGKVALTGGEMIIGTVAEFVSDGTDLILSDKPEWQPGAALTSAATIDLATTTGEYCLVNGATGPVTALGTLPAGTLRVLRFGSTPTLTHNATSLILPGAANIVAAAGDIGWFISEGAGNWRCVSYVRASGAAVVGGVTIPLNIFATGQDLSTAVAFNAFNGLAATSVTLPNQTALASGWFAEVWHQGADVVLTLNARTADAILSNEFSAAQSALGLNPGDGVTIALGTANSMRAQINREPEWIIVTVLTATSAQSAVALEFANLSSLGDVDIKLSAQLALATGGEAFIGLQASTSASTGYTAQAWEGANFVYNAAAGAADAITWNGAGFAYLVVQRAGGTASQFALDTSIRIMRIADTTNYKDVIIGPFHQNGTANRTIVGFGATEYRSTLALKSIRIGGEISGDVPTRALKGNVALYKRRAKW